MDDRETGEHLSKPTRTSIGAAALLGLVSSGANIAGAILRSKVVALQLGPTGTGFVAESNQIIALAMVPAAAFAGVALTTGIAKSRATASLVIAASAAWSFLVATLSTLAVVMAGPWLGSFGDQEHVRAYFALSAVAAVVNLGIGIITTALMATERLPTATRVNLLGSLASTVATCALTYSYGLSGQYLAMAAAPLIPLAFGIRALAKAALIPSLARLVTLDFAFLRSALSVGGASLAAGAAAQAALSTIRFTLEAHGGHESNGQFQAAWSVGSLYFGFVLGGLGNHVFPRYAAARSTDDFLLEISEASRFVWRVAPPVVLIALSMRDQVIALLYSSKFEAASSILGWQLAGDVAKAQSWVFAGLLLYRSQTRAFLFVEVVGAGLLAIGTIILLPVMGISGSGAAYFISYCVYLFVTWLVIRRTFSIDLPSNIWTRVLVLSMCFAAFNAAIERWPVVRWTGMCFAGAWAWRNGLILDAVRLAQRAWAKLGGGGGHHGHD